MNKYIDLKDMNEFLVEQNEWFLRCIKKQNHEICKLAGEKDQSALIYVNDEFYKEELL